MRCKHVTTKCTKQGTTARVFPTTHATSSRHGTTIRSDAATQQRNGRVHAPRRATNAWLAWIHSSVYPTTGRASSDQLPGLELASWAQHAPRWPAPAQSCSCYRHRLSRSQPRPRPVLGTQPGVGAWPATANAARVLWARAQALLQATYGAAAAAWAGAGATSC